MKDYVVTFNGIECGEDVYEPIVIEPSEGVKKMYLCVKYYNDEVACTTSAYADREIAEEISRAYKWSKVVEIIL